MIAGSFWLGGVQRFEDGHSRLARAACFERFLLFSTLLPVASDVRPGMT
jgi:hypothetical protein